MPVAGNELVVEVFTWGRHIEITLGLIYSKKTNLYDYGFDPISFNIRTRDIGLISLSQ